jgi:hypothetical protein
MKIPPIISTAETALRKSGVRRTMTKAAPQQS